MRRILTTVLLLLAACAPASAQANVDAARKELNAGARAYREGKVAEAEEHFRRALELDPEGKNTRLFIARATQQRYTPGVEDPENVAAGERAVEAYREVLASDPASDDAYSAMIVLYSQMKNEEKVRETILQRANNFSLPNEKRAEAFVALSNRLWQCSYDVTERDENKKSIESPAGLVTLYTMPADAGAFLRARQCVNEGLQFAEQAVSLNQEAARNWTYKANLLREAAKLAEMEGDAAQKAEYERQYAEASEIQKRLSGVVTAQGRAGPSGPVGIGGPTTSGAGEPSAEQRKNVVISGGVLNGKAISKPAPVYPAEAKAAGAQGTVTVKIIVGEDGSVVSATAISGHPLLREAAAEAARRSSFSPTFLKGEPVRVSGVVTYNFVLR